MSDSVRVGVIGTSWYADWAHLPRMKSHPRAQLVAICGRNRERADEMACKYEIPAVYTDYRAMIQAGGLDAVVVSTPDDLHYPMTMRALDAGLHVLCEKPMALTLAQAQEMYERAEAAGVKHNYQWKWDRQRGLGSLGDQGSHMIDLARWYGGEIARVSACLSTFVERPGPESTALDPANDACTLTVQFESGAMAAIECGAVAHVAERVQEQHIRLYGSAGSLECDTDWAMPAAQVRGARGDDKQWQALDLPDDLWAGVDRAQPARAQFAQALSTQPLGDRLLVDAILEDVHVSPNFYDGLQVQAVIDAAQRSHQRGEWVELE